MEFDNEEDGNDPSHRSIDSFRTLKSLQRREHESILLQSFLETTTDTASDDKNLKTKRDIFQRTFADDDDDEPFHWTDGRMGTNLLKCDEDDRERNQENDVGALNISFATDVKSDDCYEDNYGRSSLFSFLSHEMSSIGSKIRRLTSSKHRSKFPCDGCGTDVVDPNRANVNAEYVGTDVVKNGVNDGDSTSIFSSVFSFRVGGDADSLNTWAREFASKLAASKGGRDSWFSRSRADGSQCVAEMETTIATTSTMKHELERRRRFLLENDDVQDDDCYRLDDCSTLTSNLSSLYRFDDPLATERRTSRRDVDIDGDPTFAADLSTLTDTHRPKYRFERHRFGSNARTRNDVGAAQVDLAPATTAVTGLVHEPPSLSSSSSFFPNDLVVPNEVWEKVSGSDSKRKSNERRTVPWFQRTSVWVKALISVSALVVLVSFVPLVVIVLRPERSATTTTRLSTDGVGVDSESSSNGIVDGEPFPSDDSDAPTMAPITTIVVDADLAPPTEPAVDEAVRVDGSEDVFEHTVVTFAVTGGRYENSDGWESRLANENVEFVVHLGEGGGGAEAPAVLDGEGNDAPCGDRDAYRAYVDSVREGRLRVPVLFVRTTDDGCPDAWREVFSSSSMDDAVDVVRQMGREENFFFVRRRTLFLGLSTGDEMKNAEWMRERVVGEDEDEDGGFDAAVIFGGANSRAADLLSSSFRRRQTPSLYLHQDSTGEWVQDDADFDREEEDGRRYYWKEYVDSGNDEPDRNKEEHLQGDEQGGTSWDVVNDNEFSANVTKFYFPSLPPSDFDFRSMEDRITPNEKDTKHHKHKSKGHKSQKKEKSKKRRRRQRRRLDESAARSTTSINNDDGEDRDPSSWVTVVPVRGSDHVPFRIVRVDAFRAAHGEDDAFRWTSDP